MKTQLKHSYLSVIFFIGGMLLSCSSPTNNLSRKVHIHTEVQDNFLYDDFSNITKYADGRQELSQPEPIELTWTLDKDETANYNVLISEFEDFSNCFTIRTLDSTASIYNLKIGTKYYWKVTSDLQDIEVETAPETFEVVDDCPRNLKVDGITNVRDVGGWKIDGNHRVKQGLLFRGGRLNTSFSNQISKEVTEEGKRVLLEDLKIKSEMDLRTIDDNEIGSITSSVLGDAVQYLSCPMYWQNNILLVNQEMVRHIFSDILAHEDNYPLYFHCNIGTDRTGMIAYLLNGLLGVAEDDLYYDYLFSNFGLIGGIRTLNNIKYNYVETINKTEGDKLSNKIYNHLISIGVSKTDIDNIKNIFIEEI